MACVIKLSNILLTRNGQYCNAWNVAGPCARKLPKTNSELNRHFIFCSFNQFTNVVLLVHCYGIVDLWKYLAVLLMIFIFRSLESFIWNIFHQDLCFPRAPCTMCDRSFLFCVQSNMLYCSIYRLLILRLSSCRFPHLCLLLFIKLFRSLFLNCKTKFLVLLQSLACYHLHSFLFSGLSLLRGYHKMVAAANINSRFHLLGIITMCHWSSCGQSGSNLRHLENIRLTCEFHTIDIIFCQQPDCHIEPIYRLFSIIVHTIFCNFSIVLAYFL